MFSGRPSAKWIVLALGALVLLAPSTTSLAVSAVDRPLSATVAGDGDGFIGVDTEDIYLDNGHHKAVTLATVTNNLGAPASVSVELLSNQHGPPPIVKDPTGIDRLPNGASGELTADITCANVPDKTEDIEIKIVAITDDQRVTLWETVTIHCTGEPPAGNDDTDNGDDDKDEDDDKGDDAGAGEDAGDTDETEDDGAEHKEDDD